MTYLSYFWTFVLKFCVAVAKFIPGISLQTSIKTIAPLFREKPLDYLGVLKLLTLPNLTKSLWYKYTS
jgi:hypothetical protein